jgi:pilus assembly protein CpaB
MKAARIVVLAVAIGAAGVAALLAARSDRPADLRQAATAKLKTVDQLIANIGTGQTVSLGGMNLIGFGLSTAAMQKWSSEGT